MKRLGTVCGSAILVVMTACGSDAASDQSVSTDSGVETTSADSGTAVFPATLGDAVTGYASVVDLAVRTNTEGSTTYAVEQAGTIRLVGDGGRPGALMADLSALTRERGEQGLLGLAFSADGATAYVNYTDRKGDTTVDAMGVLADGSFDLGSRTTIYTLEQPYRNHNGGDLIVSPDGRYLFVFNGDGGSADDPDRFALDATSQLGKIVRIDLDATGEDAVSIWASGLRNPWRSYLDPVTEDLWIADVGQSMWEEVNVVPLAQSAGVSFGWSALEGTAKFNEDQAAANDSMTQVVPIHTYPHENDDCSISGGAVYRGASIPVVGTWYVFSDFCSGRVRALCVTEDRDPCGVVDVGTVGESVAVLPDAQGELWVLALSGQMVPIVASS